MREAGELVAGAPAYEAEAVDQLELVVAQQVHHKAAGLEDQIVAVVELVDIDGHARDRGDDRRADRAVGDHAVARGAARRRDRHDRRRQVAQQLVDLVGLQDWHGP